MAAVLEEGEKRKMRKPKKSKAARRRVMGFVLRNDLGKAMGETSDGLIRGAFQPPIFWFWFWFWLYGTLQGVEMEMEMEIERTRDSSKSENSWKHV